MELARVADAYTDDVSNAVSDCLPGTAQSSANRSSHRRRRRCRTVSHVLTTRAWTDDNSNIVQVMSFGRVN